MVDIIQKHVILFSRSFYTRRKSRADSSRRDIDMAIRNIRYNEDPILRKKCKEVKIIDDKIRQILDDMLETLQETENGAAIAANQVGILKRLVVIDYEDYHFKLVNPVILE